MVQLPSWKTCLATHAQIALENIAEFSTLVLERRNSFLGKRIDIASNGLTGEQAAKILSDELGRKIKYVQVPLEQIRQASEDIALMYEWYERVGTGIDITNLHQQYPEVNWRRFKDWVKSQNWDDIRQQQQLLQLINKILHNRSRNPSDRFLDISTNP